MGKKRILKTTNKINIEHGIDILARSWNNIRSINLDTFEYEFNFEKDKQKTRVLKHKLISCEDDLIHLIQRMKEAIQEL